MDPSKSSTCTDDGELMANMGDAGSMPENTRVVRGKIFGDGGCGGDCKLLSVGMRGGLGGWDVERTRGLGGLTGQGEERTGYERNAGQETRSRNDGRRQK